MNIAYPTLELLKQFKFLRGSLARRMRERNSIEVDAALDPDLAFGNMDYATFLAFTTKFLRRYTEEEIAKSPYWANRYTTLHRRRFELGEPVLRGSANWKVYLYNLRQANNEKDRAWAEDETKMMNDAARDNLRKTIGEGR